MILGGTGGKDYKDFLEYYLTRAFFDVILIIVEKDRTYAIKRELPSRFGPSKRE